MPAPTKLDRLSALIEKLRFQAELLPVDTDQALLGNFFVYSCPIEGLGLMFLPHVDRGRDVASELCSEKDVLVGARVLIGGATSLLSIVLPERLDIHLCDAPEIKPLVKLLLEEVRVPRCGGPAVFNRLSEVVLIRLLRHAIGKGVTELGLVAGLGHPNLARALVAIHENPAHGWNLEMLADEAGMSRTQFAVAFKKVVGMTPGNYLSLWRLSLAHMAFEQGEPVKSVSKAVGFSSPVALSRAFQRQFGFKPKDVVVLDQGMV